jgi:hypothetical protein
LIIVIEFKKIFEHPSLTTTAEPVSPEIIPFLSVTLEIFGAMVIPAKPSTVPDCVKMPPPKSITMLLEVITNIESFGLVGAAVYPLPYTKLPGKLYIIDTEFADIYELATAHIMSK